MSEQFQISKGNPTDDEIGALFAVLIAASRPVTPVRETDDRPIAGGWKSYWRTVRTPLNPGREAWRTSYR